jgi:hypothetical protein
MLYPEANGQGASMNALSIAKEEQDKWIMALIEYCHPEQYLRGRGLKVQSDNINTSWENDTKKDSKRVPHHPKCTAWQGAYLHGDTQSSCK